MYMNTHLSKQIQNQAMFGLKLHKAANCICRLLIFRYKTEWNDSSL